MDSKDVRKRLDTFKPLTIKGDSPLAQLRRAWVGHSVDAKVLKQAGFAQVEDRGSWGPKWQATYQTPSEPRRDRVVLDILLSPSNRICDVRLAEHRPQFDEPDDSTIEDWLRTWYRSEELTPRLVGKLISNVQPLRQDYPRTSLNDEIDPDLGELLSRTRQSPPHSWESLVSGACDLVDELHNLPAASLAAAIAMHHFGDAKRWSLLANLGAIQSHLYHIGELEQLTLFILELDQLSAAELQYLGVIFTDRLDRPDIGTMLLGQAVREDPKVIQNRSNLWVATHKAMRESIIAGEYDEMWNHFENARQLVPELRGCALRSLYWAALYQAAQGHIEKARELCHLCVQQNPDYFEAARLYRQLREYQPDDHVYWEMPEPGFLLREKSSSELVPDEF